MSNVAGATKTIEASIIQKNIYNQLQASRDIFEIIPMLAKLARDREEDKDLRETLQDVMERLLDVGEDLSDSASNTGGEVFNLPPGNSSASGPQEINLDPVRDT